VRTRSIVLGFFSGLVPLSALAAAPPADVLLAGTIARQYLVEGAGSWCLFEGTNSTFMSKISPSAKLISFPDITIQVPTASGDTPTVYTVGGQARLTFNPNVPDAGKIAFIPVASNPADVNTPNFRNYVENYNAATGTLTVKFIIRFPACALQVSATYRK